MSLFIAELSLILCLGGRGGGSTSFIIKLSLILSWCGSNDNPPPHPLKHVIHHK